MYVDCEGILNINAESAAIERVQFGGVSPKSVGRERKTPNIERPVSLERHAAGIHGATNRRFLAFERQWRLHRPVARVAVASGLS